MIVGSISILALIYKLITLDIIIDLSSFSFSDFLSMILSLFALGISIAFYFKASDTSNKFYDNTYKFTKDISENIGRMEEHFGERLKHLDEGYAKFFDSEMWKQNGTSKEKEALEKEKAELEEKLKSITQDVNKLIDNTKLTQQEKIKLKAELRTRESEVEVLNRRLIELEKKYQCNELISDTEFERWTDRLTRFVLKSSANVNEFLSANPTECNDFLYNLLVKTPYINQLKSIGWIDSDNRIKIELLIAVRNKVINRINQQYNVT